MTLTAIDTDTKKIVLEQQFESEDLENVLERIELKEYGTADQIEIIIK